MTSPYRNSEPSPPAAPEDVLLTTCDHIEGYRVVRYFGLISQTATYSGTYGQGFVATAAKARGDVARALLARAQQLKANAVTGLRYDSNMDATFYEVTVYGTAVRIEPVPPTGPTK